jgi:D-beta-D-heptose 7-phosphate kinase/D-beta-D-heptose 1-phosphate adenosyltransferase
MRTGRKRPLLESKIRPLGFLKKLTAYLKAHGKVTVFTNGCFDLIHYGHVKYLQDAKRKGDLLIVGVNSDRSVRRLKGKKRPLVAQADRARVIAGLESVDYVVIFNEDTPLNLIKALKPDVLVKGADWKPSAIVGADILHSYGGKTATITFVKGRSTTGLIEKIAKRY